MLGARGRGRRGGGLTRRSGVGWARCATSGTTRSTRRATSATGSPSASTRRGRRSASSRRPRSARRSPRVEPDRGGGWPGRPAARATLELQRAIAELQAADVVVRDVVRGLVDFPALRDGEEIYLCWLVDEPEIEHWHELDAGFAGRRPLAR